MGENLCREYLAFKYNTTHAHTHTHKNAQPAHVRADGAFPRIKAGWMSTVNAHTNSSMNARLQIYKWKPVESSTNE